MTDAENGGPLNYLPLWLAASESLGAHCRGEAEKWINAHGRMAAQPYLGGEKSLPDEHVPFRTWHNIREYLVAWVEEVASSVESWGYDSDGELA